MATNMTFVDFVTPVPADWLNNVNTYVQFLVNKDVIFAQNASGQAIPPSVSTVITNWTTYTDRLALGHFNPVTGIFTAPVNGWYRLQGHVTWGQPVAAGISLSFAGVANGVALFIDEILVDQVTDQVHSIHGEGTAFLTAGQQMWLQAFQATGSNVTLKATLAETTITIEQVA